MRRLTTRGIEGTTRKVLRAALTCTLKKYLNRVVKNPEELKTGEKQAPKRAKIEKLGSF